MSPKRKEVDRYGKRGRVSVRVVREETPRAAYHRVLWKDARSGRRRAESFPATRHGLADARAFAEALYGELMAGPHTPGVPGPAMPGAPAASATLGELWSAYGRAHFEALAPKSITTLTQRWLRFERFATKARPAVEVTRETMQDFLTALRGQKRAPNQIRLLVQTVRLVYAWGLAADLIPTTKETSAVATFRAKLSKAERRAGPEMREFRMEERGRVLAQFDPRGARTWRPWVFTVLAAQTGQRAHAIRHLAWADVGVEAGVIRWNPDYQKTGAAHVQAMPADVRDALWVAYGWRLATGYPGPWVLFGAQRRSRGVAARLHGAARVADKRGHLPIIDQPWTYQAYIRQLDVACKAAGVARARFQGAHAFRRGVAGDVADRLGLEAAANWIGDKDLRVVRRHYTLTREDQQRAIAEGLPRLTTKDDGEGSE